MLLCSMGALAAGTLCSSGCYAPAPANGAYSCSGSGNCPDGQHCTCGQCVVADEAAACAFTAVAMPPTCADWPDLEGPAQCVHEHEAFPLLITALEADGKTVAGGFGGGVTLTSSYGDAALVVGAPVAFSHGVATVQATLNRETLYVAGGARITVHAGTAHGATGYIAVVPPHWTVDATGVQLSPNWADVNQADPDVVADSGGYRMYFDGGGHTGAAKMLTQGLGVATSSDGKSWTVTASAPLLASDKPTDLTHWLLGPAAFQSSTGDWRLLYRGLDTSLFSDVLGSISTTDGLSAFAAAKTAVAHDACHQCVSLSSPSVVTTPDGTPGDFDLFFLDVHEYMNSVLTDGSAVHHASSTDDGATWGVDPLPVLSDNPVGTGERVIFAPRVIVDGSVYKMFYAANADGNAFATFSTPDELCSGAFTVGYATSSDGVDWVRSPSNPVITPALAWAGGAQIISPGSLLPADPTNPAKGYTMWFSTFQHVTVDGATLCVPAGIGRAERP